MNRRSHRIRTLGRLAAGTWIVLGGGTLVARPAEADEFELQHRMRALRTPQSTSGGHLSRAPEPGEIIPIPGQPINPPSPRPPQGRTPCAVLPPSPANGVLLQAFPDWTSVRGAWDARFEWLWLFRGWSYR
jgi:hypothetical protein